MAEAAAAAAGRPPAAAGPPLLTSSSPSSRLLVTLASALTESLWKTGKSVFPRRTCGMTRRSMPGKDLKDTIPSFVGTKPQLANVETTVKMEKVLGLIFLPMSTSLAPATAQR